MKQKAKRVLTLFAAVAALCVAVFFGARYGWHLAGFSACQTARIESVGVETDRVKIEGGWPGVFPEAFIGYHAEEVDGVLYVGFKYNKLLGVWIYDKGNFQIEIPVEGQIRAVYMKSGDNEYQIWPEQTMEGDAKHCISSAQFATHRETVENKDGMPYDKPVKAGRRLLPPGDKKSIREEVFP